MTKYQETYRTRALRPFVGNATARLLRPAVVKLNFLRPRLHEQIKPPLIAQILDPYKVTAEEFEQIKYVLFAHVNAA